MSYTLVLDVGKTHVKLHVIDSAQTSVFSRGTDNGVVDTSPYPHFDTEALWQWMLAAIGEAAAEYSISNISITTHGAAAALINRHKDEADGLVLPVLDYEHTGIESCNASYDQLRPTFTETRSPSLPAGLNLGRQLYWQESTFPEAFAEVTDILLYPQYWAWRLTGQRRSEVTSLGCHTDLWAPGIHQFSSLVNTLGWERLFPELVPAWTSLGQVKPEISRLTGLPETCHVFTGVHDSNASFLRYRAHYDEEPFTVISTGTWSILMTTGSPLERLETSRDMLANVDVTGQPVACARFMGGREFAAVCASVGTDIRQPYGETTLQALVDRNIMALPNFTSGGGPFPSRKGKIVGSPKGSDGTALASLYCALMLDYILDLLDAKGDIFIEGAFLKNPLLCALLAQLRPDQQIRLSSDDTGTVQGCASLADWDNRTRNAPAVQACGPTEVNGLSHYRELWRSKLELGARQGVHA